MALNWVWTGFFIVAFATAVVRWLLGEAGIFQALLTALFDGARTGFEISLGLAGIMALWLGLMRVGERAGMVELLARLAGPLLTRLFPAVPAGHPAQGAMTMNISANLLGLDNAATPLGLKAMQELQTLNREPAGAASNAQIMFVVMNTAGLTLIPTSVIAIRQSVALKQGLGAGFNAADIFLPTLLVTFASLLAGVLALAIGLPLLVGGMQLEISAFLGWIDLQRHCGRGVRLPGVQLLLPVRDKAIVLALHGLAAPSLLAATTQPALARAAGSALLLAHAAGFAALCGVDRRRSRFIRGLKEQG